MPKEQLGRAFQTRSTLLTGGSPPGFAVCNILWAFPATSVIAFFALACMLIGMVGLTPTANERKGKTTYNYQTGEQK